MLWVSLESLRYFELYFFTAFAKKTSRIERKRTGGVSSVRRRRAPKSRANSLSSLSVVVHVRERVVASLHAPSVASRVCDRARFSPRAHFAAQTPF